MTQKSQEKAKEVINNIVKEAREDVLREVLRELDEKREMIHNILSSEEANRLIMNCRGEIVKEYFDKRARLREKGKAYYDITMLLIKKIYER